jgi:hypothetical protein
MLGFAGFRADKARPVRVVVRGRKPALIHTSKGASTMKSILIASLCLVSCAEGLPPGITASYEAICYDDQSDCWKSARYTCPLGYNIIDQEVRSEGRAGDNRGQTRFVERYVCREPK